MSKRVYSKDMLLSMQAQCTIEVEDMPLVERYRGGEQARGQGADTSQNLEKLLQSKQAVVHHVSVTIAEGCRSSNAAAAG